MNLKINESGAYERELDENWAAAYAKRLTDQEAYERDQAITAAVGLEAAARKEAIAEEAAARVAKDNALADGTALENNSISSRHIREGNVTSGKIHDLNVTEAKLATDSVTTAKIKNLNVTEAKLAAGSVTTEKIKDKNVTRAKLANDVEIVETINVSGDLQFRYGDGEHISYGSLSDKVVSVFGLPIRDAAAQEWITNNCIYDTIDPPETFDVGFVPHTGLLYLQSDGIAVVKIFVLSGTTALGANIWTQIYPAFQEYSTTPVRVGTWTVGNISIPIWRVTFDIDLGDIDDSEYDQILENKELFGGAYYIPVNDINNCTCYVINGRGVLVRDYALVGNMDVYKVGAYMEFDDVPLPSSGSREGFHIYGWVEFATPASNIKTS